MPRRRTNGNSSEQGTAQSPYLGQNHSVGQSDVLVELLKNQQQQQQQQTEILARLVQQQARPSPGIKQFRALHPRNFTGKENPLESEEWIRSTKDNLRAAQIPEASWVDIAKLQLTDNARNWWDAEETRLDAPITWETFKERFDAKYFSSTAKRALREQFIALKQGSMSVDEYDAQFSKLSRFAPQMVADAKDCADQFRQGLSLEIQERLAATELPTQDAVLDAARRCEAVFKKRQEQEHLDAVVPTDPVIMQAVLPPSQTKRLKNPRVSLPQQTHQALCGRCGRPGHLRRTCRLKVGQCLGCGAEGHLRKNCPNTVHRRYQPGVSQQIQRGAPLSH